MLRQILVIIFIFISMGFAASNYANELSVIEKTIRDDVKAQTPDQIHFLEKIVNINSGTSNAQGVQKVGELLRAEFAALGFSVRWMEEPASMHHAGTLIAERHGTQGKRVLLIGHLDTVFPDTSKFQVFDLKKNSAKGPGVIDDKGGIVVILYALKALQAAHALDNKSITIVLTGDEEESGKPTAISRKPLIDLAESNDVALDFEPMITLETATIGRRGISAWTVTVRGNESHSATIFQKEVGAGAIFEVSRILNSLRTQLVGSKGVTFNPGLVSGGTTISDDNNTAQGTVFGKNNVVAKVALARGDYRYLTIKQKHRFEKRLRAIVKKQLPGTHSTVTFQDGIPAMPPTVNNLRLLKLYSSVSHDLSFGKVTAFDPVLRGAGDISYVAAKIPENLAGLGALGYGTHSRIESIELRSLPIQTQRAAVLIYRLTNASSPL